MAYVIPRAEITQQFTATPVFTSSPLPALILGPNYKLSRYAVASEKANTKLQHPDDAALLNFYQPGSDEEYEYPSGDTNVDVDYVKLFIESAEVEVRNIAAALSFGHTWPTGTMRHRQRLPQGTAWKQQGRRDGAC